MESPMKTRKEPAEALDRTPEQKARSTMDFIIDTASKKVAYEEESEMSSAQEWRESPSWDWKDRAQNTKYKG